MKSMIKHLLILLLTLLVPLQTHAREKVTVILDWLPNPNHGPLVVAKELGYFKEAGLDVELIGPTDPSDPPKWVAAKKADVAITYQPKFMQYVDRGLPLIRIGTLIDKPLSCVVALKERGINDITDLKNKRIGSSTSGLTSILLNKLLAKADLSQQDVTLIHVKYNLNQALLTHRVDAVSGMMRNVEVPELEALGHHVVAFFPEEHGVPTYSELIYVAHVNHQHDAKLKRFIQATEKATRYIIHHPKEAWQLFVKAYPAEKSPVNEKIWFYTVPYFDDTPNDFYAPEWKQFAQFLYDNKLIKTIQPMSRYAIRV